MKRSSLVVAAVATLLALNAQVPVAARAAAPVIVDFAAVGAEQQFVVPDGVTGIHVVLIGGHGGTGGGGAGGRGAEVTGDLDVAPGTTLYVEVAGNGGYMAGGFNGGGVSQEYGGGGGASDLRTSPRANADSLSTRLIVAAGGGGGGSSGNGGDAGSAGSPNLAGNALGGEAGTSTSGGAGGSGGISGTSGGDGSLGQGGSGWASWGGGGGSGLYGGGAGGSSSSGGSAGGGGGSSLVPSGGTYAIDTTGTPKIVISYAAPTGTSFNVASATSMGTNSMAVTFDAPPDAAQAATLANYSVAGLTLSGTPSLSGSTVTITTSTQAAQSYTVTVTGVTRASDAEPLTTDTASFTGTPSAAPPEAGISPASLSFGNVPVGSPSSSQQVTVTNTAAAGAADLHIGQLGTVGANAASFGLGADQCSNASLAPGASCTLVVTFLPTARGPYSATLQVPDDAADSPQSVALSGTGVGPVAEVTPSSIDFGTVDVGTTSSARTVTITNTGDTGQDLVFSAATITGANAADFTFVSEHCVTTGVLEAGSSCTIELAFTPSASSGRSATLSITDNAADSPQTVSLTGTGGTPSADLAVSISASLTKAKGVSAVTYTITVLNTGPSTATGILVNDALSSETTFVSATATEGTCVTPVKGASGVVSCSLASLSTGSSSETQVVVTVIARKTSITNTVTVSATTPDPNLANNTASITTRVK